jgi:hypothetical protein
LWVAKDVRRDWTSFEDGECDIRVEVESRTCRLAP